MRGQAVQTATRRLVGQQTLSGSSVWSHPGLLAVCIVLPMIEVGLLWGVGLTSALGIAPSVTAPVPFAIFHDLRWLMVYHNSWAGFAVEAVAMLAFRGALTALLVRLAWPRGVARPSPAVLLRNATVFTLVSAVLLVPWVGLLFGLAVMPVSWLFFAAVPPVLAVGLLIHHGVVRSGWQAPAARTTGWVALTFVVLTLSGAALSASPAGLRLPVAAAAGLFNAWAWNGIVNVLSLAPRVPRRTVPLVPIALVLLLAGVAAGAGLGFRASVSKGGSSLARATYAVGGRPVLLVSGLGTHWDGVQRNWLPGRLDERRFSYRGQDRTGRPLPYSDTDTHHPLPELVRVMRAQVETFHRQSGHEVAIVAESEGALVAKTSPARTCRPTCRWCARSSTTARQCATCSPARFPTPASSPCSRWPTLWPPRTRARSASPARWCRPSTAACWPTTGSAARSPPTCSTVRSTRRRSGRSPSRSCGPRRLPGRCQSCR